MFKDLWIKFKAWLARGFVASQESSTSDKDVFETSSSYAIAAGVFALVALALVIGAFVVASKVATFVVGTVGITGFFGLICLIAVWWIALSTCLAALGELCGALANAVMSGIEQNYDDLAKEFGKQAVDDALHGSFKAKFSTDGDSKPAAA